MLSDEEKKAMKYFYNLRATIDESNMLFDEDIDVKCGKETIKQITTILNLIEKQSKEIEELKETLKCTQNSWYEDTQKIEEMKKQIDLNNECEIALNNRIMDLENADKKWEDKIKAKTIEIKNRPVKDEFITVSQGKLNTIIDMESLLEKE